MKIQDFHCISDACWHSVKLSSARNISFILKLVNEILCIWPTDSLSEMSGTLYMVYNPTKRTIK